MRKVPISVLVAAIGVIGSIIVAYINIIPLMRSPEKLVSEKKESTMEAPKPITLNAPFLVASYFYPSGWMGDGESSEGKKFIQVNTDFTDCNRPDNADGLCIQIKYRPNPEGRGFAGIYWQYPDKNWGGQVGRRITGAQRIVFWSRGENGGEVVEFKAGGINGREMKYQDSFEVAQRLRLKREWSRYEIPLAKQDLSNVIGAFAWAAARDANPNGLTFYLDDIRYE